MTLRAAIYACYSSDLQSISSIEDQVRLCRERARHEGWQIVATYEDAAISGASFMRPGILRLQQDARGAASTSSSRRRWTGCRATKPILPPSTRT